MIPPPPIVLQILPSMNQGGVENAAFDIAEALTLAYPDTPTYIVSQGGSLLQKEHRFKHIQLSVHSKNPLQMGRNVIRLLKLIREHKISIIHARSRAPAWSALIAARLLGIPLITTYHAAYKGRTFFKKLYNSVMARGDRVIVISRFVEQHVKKMHPEARTILIYEGTDTAFFTPSHDRISSEARGEKVFFLPSRLSPIKGAHIALRAFKRLTLEYEDTRLILIRTGKAGYIKIIEALIEELGLGDSVKFIEPTFDLRPVYGQSLAVLMTSIVPEAMPRVCVEALSMENILIATDIGANPEICKNNETGFLVKPGDVDDLHEAMEKAINLSAEERLRLQNNGRQRACTHFSSTSMYQKTFQLYQEVLTCRSSS